MKGSLRCQRIHQTRKSIIRGPVVIPLALCVGLATLVGTGRLAPAGGSHPPTSESAAGPGANLAPLLAQLNHKSAAKRREALLRLTDAGVSEDELFPVVAPLLTDEDPLVRLHAARAVWITGQFADASVPVLVDLLRPEQAQVCALASFLVGEIGPAAHEALPALRARLTEPDPLLRMHAAEAIVKIDPSDVAAHTVLVQALSAPSADMRYFAACALINSGEDFRSAACGGLIEVLADDDLRIATSAALSLESIQGKRLGDLLSTDDGESVKNPSDEPDRLEKCLADRNPAARRQEVTRLILNSAAAHEAHVSLQIAVEDDEPVVRAYAAWALWQIDPQSDQVLPVLIDLLGTIRPNVTTLATSVLAGMGESAADALPALYDLMETSDPMVRLHVAIAISRIDSRAREPIQVLAEATHDHDSDLRYLGVLSLGHVSPLSRRQAERELAAASTDRNLRVRSAAARAQLTLQSAVASARTAARQPLAAPEPAAPEPPVPQPVAPQPVAARMVAVAEVVPQPAAAVAERATQPAPRPAPSSRPMPTVALHTQSESEPVPTVVDESLDDDTSAIPILDEVEGDAESDEEETDPTGLPRVSKDDEETLEERKSIRQLRARITAPDGEFPADYATRRFEREPAYYHGYGMTRGWYNSSIAWNNPGICHNPLWFQDLNLERYGYHYGIAQTVVSSIKFCADAALLPYKLIAEPPCDCVYTLGYDRPGNCVPYRYYRVPCSVEAAAFLGGVTTGLVFLAL